MTETFADIRLPCCRSTNLAVSFMFPAMFPAMFFQCYVIHLPIIFLHTYVLSYTHEVLPSFSFLSLQLITKNHPPPSKSTTHTTTTASKKRCAQLHAAMDEFFRAQESRPDNSQQLLYYLTNPRSVDPNAVMPSMI